MAAERKVWRRKKIGGGIKTFLSAAEPPSTFEGVNLRLKEMCKNLEFWKNQALKTLEKPWFLSEKNVATLYRHFMSKYAT